MSAKSDRKRQKRDELQAQSQTQLAALRARHSELNPDGTQDTVFRCTWPMDHPGFAKQYADIESIHFGDIGATTELIAGKLALRLPAPYSHLVIVHGEELTIGKALKVHQAAIALHAGARQTSQL